MTGRGAGQAGHDSKDGRLVDSGYDEMADQVGHDCLTEISLTMATSMKPGFY